MSTNNETGDTVVIKKQQNRNNDRYSSSMNSEMNNPCTKEQSLSLKCLSDNNYDHDACMPHFVNYKNCREFWSKVSSDRRRKRIKPYLPPPEERAEIKAEYLRSKSA